MYQLHEEKMASLGIVLPPAPKPAANYVTGVVSGSLLFLAGQGPKTADGKLMTGTVGLDVSEADAYQHARLCGLNLLAAASDHLGSINRIRRVVRVLGLVRATPDFANHPEVINGCSDLFNEIFGEHGWHARSAVGAGSLPRGITVEVEATFEIAP